VPLFLEYVLQIIPLSADVIAYTVESVPVSWKQCYYKGLDFDDLKMFKKWPIKLPKKSRKMT
jgi:hypothetical protein